MDLYIMPNRIISFPMSQDVLFSMIGEAVKLQLLPLTEKGAGMTSAKLLTSKEICKFLNISEPTLIKLRRKKLIPYLNVGVSVRYQLNDVIKAFENRNKRKKQNVL